MKKETKASGQVVRELRKIKGLTQMELAELVGVSYQQIQKYEKSFDSISVERLKQIAKALDAPMTLFFPSGRDVVAESQETYGKLKNDERLLLELFGTIKDRKTKQAILDFLRTLASNERHSEK
jgi:transcriptional regulator with XRE-family HTH domain